MRVAKSKAASRKRPNAIVRFFRETVAELRKVNWPTRKEATQLTVVVLLVVIIMSTFLGVLDFLFTRLFGFIIGLGQ
ncbi:MAG: preprotein translocase subunit SecE [Anaerolineales bacterium]|nr:MAG: preprotein translocase subunit SecE [Anaerolineales bacterium]